jgi:hypothetical protein
LGKAVDVFDPESFLVAHDVEIDSNGFLIGENRLAVIAKPLAMIFEVFLVPFAYVGVEGYQICFEHKSITSFAPIFLYQLVMT